MFLIWEIFLGMTYTVSIVIDIVVHAIGIIPADKSPAVIKMVEVMRLTVFRLGDKFAFKRHKTDTSVEKIPPSILTGIEEIIILHWCNN